MNKYITKLLIILKNSYENNKQETTNNKRRITNLAFSFLLIFTTLAGCNKSDSGELINITKANGLSNISSSLGLTTISQLAVEPNYQAYNVKSISKTVNNIPLNLQDATIKFKKDGENYYISLETINKIEFKFFLENKTKKYYKIEKDNFIDLANSSNVKDLTYFAISLNIFSDIISFKKSLSTNIKNNNLLQSNVDDAFKNNTKLVAPEGEHGGCERTILSIRPTESSAISHVNTSTDSFIKDHPDCKKVYGVDTGCLWGGYACVATQSIKCTGGGCNVTMGELE